MQEELNIILDTFLALGTLLLSTRIMGRKSMAHLTFFDYVVGITLGSIAASMAVHQLEIYLGLISLTAATVLMLLFNVVTRYSLTARKLVNSVPLIVLYKGQILEENVRKKYYNVNEILEELREQGIFDPSEVEVGILETDGKLSVLKKPQYQPITKKDLSLANTSNLRTSEYTGKELVISGKVIEQNLIGNGLSVEWLKNQLKLQGVEEIDELTLVMLTPEGTLYFDKKSDLVPDQLK